MGMQMFWLKTIWFLLVFCKIARITAFAQISWGILLLPLFAYLLARLTPALLALYLMAKTLHMAKAQIDAMQSPVYDNGSRSYDGNGKKGRTIDGESRPIDNS